MILDTELTISKTMEPLLSMKYDEHFRHVLALLDTTVERGNILFFFLIFKEFISFYSYILLFLNKHETFYIDYKAKIIALDVLSVQFKDHGNDKELMKKKLEEMRIECERLMHNLKSSNRLLDEANKEKRHAEIERDNLV